MSAGDEIVYLGHATILVDLDGTRLLTDPVVRPRIGHISRRVEAIDRRRLDGLDGVLVSHAHHDHLDYRSLKRVAARLPVAVPRGLGPSLRRRGITVVEELDVGEHMRIGTLDVLAVHAEHDGRRYPSGRRFPALGFVVDGGPRVYFAGDTDLFDGMRDLGPIDVALIPISGWGKRTGPGHLDPERAAEAVARIRPRIAVPIHWGTLASPSIATATLGGPAKEFARLAPQAAPGVEIVVVPPGGSLQLDGVRRA